MCMMNYLDGTSIKKYEGVESISELLEKFAWEGIDRIEVKKVIERAEAESRKKEERKSSSDNWKKWFLWRSIILFSMFDYPIMQLLARVQCLLVRGLHRYSRRRYIPEVRNH